MKKTTFTLLALLLTTLCWSQIISTSPPFVTQTSGVIEVTFNASLGSGGLKGYTGDVYAHTGVITSASTSSTDWKHAPTWLDNSDKYKMTSLGDNKWKLTITPSLNEYYGISTGETVSKIAFVFRNSTGTKEGKDTGGADILVDVYQAGLNVAFTNQTSNQTVTVGSALDFTIASSLTATTLNLYVNGTVVKTVNGVSNLSYSYQFTSANDYTIVAEAILGSQSVKDTLLVCAPKAVTTQTRPSGLNDGINYINSTTVTLILHAPNKQNVFLIGDFNNWSQLNAYQLKKDGEYWWIELTDLVPNKIYGFQYLVDDTIKISDPYTEMVLDPWNDQYINEDNNIYPNLKAYPTAKTSGLVATFQTAKIAYNWEVPNFTMPSKENMVIYELLLRDFTSEKSLDAAILKLDYLKTLGITAIELMPIQEFDGNNSWGYNPSHYFAPDKAYGNADTYKKFIDECHKKGIAVILDIVLNHASGNCPFAMLYYNNTTYKPTSSNPWMNVDAPHPYSVLNDFNHSYSGTSDYFKRMVQYWITEYKVDGYRLDLTKGLTQTSSTESTSSNYDQSRIDIISAYYDAAKSVKSDVMFILEHFCSNSEETVLANKGMYLWRKANDAFSQAAMGYQSSSDFSGLVTSPRNWVGYAESHDEERNFYKAKMYGDGTIKTDSITRIARVPLNIAFATLLPGPKMIWEFEELGYDYSINWGIDKNGNEANNDSYRTYSKPAAWGLLDYDHRKAAYDASAKIISLRKMYPTAFTQGTFSTQVSSSDWSGGRRIALTHDDLDMIVLGNFNSTNTATTYPSFQKTGTWYNLINGTELNVTNTSMSLTLQAGELEIYTDRKINFPSALNFPNSDVDCTVYPSITKSTISISSANKIKSITLFNLQGSIVKTLINSAEMDLTNCSTGLYILQVESSNGKSVHKIIKE